MNQSERNQHVSQFNLVKILLPKTVADWNPFFFKKKHRFHILPFPNSTGLFTKPTGCHHTKHRFSPDTGKLVQFLYLFTFKKKETKTKQGPSTISSSATKVLPRSQQPGQDDMDGWTHARPDIHPRGVHPWYRIPYVEANHWIRIGVSVRLYAPLLPFQCTKNIYEDLGCLCRQAPYLYSPTYGGIYTVSLSSSFTLYTLYILYTAT